MRFGTRTYYCILVLYLHDDHCTSTSSTLCREPVSAVPCVPRRSPATTTRSGIHSLVPGEAGNFFLPRPEKDLNVKRFLLPSFQTRPTFPICSSVVDESCMSVSLSPSFSFSFAVAVTVATNLCPISLGLVLGLVLLYFRRPTMYASRGVLSRLNSTVYVWEASGLVLGAWNGGR